MKLGIDLPSSLICRIYFIEIEYLLPGIIIRCSFNKKLTGSKNKVGFRPKRLT